MLEGNFEVLVNTIKELKKYKKVLLLTCSNRGEEIAKKESPKSSILAKVIHNNLKNSVILDVTKLKIYPCEGNVSLMEGNICGVKEALLDNLEKNPSKCPPLKTSKSTKIIATFTTPLFVQAKNFFLNNSLPFTNPTQKRPGNSSI